MAPFDDDDDELAAGEEEVVVDPVVGAVLELEPAAALELEPAPPAGAPEVGSDAMAAAWKAAKVLLTVGLMAKTIPCSQ